MKKLLCLILIGLIASSASVWAEDTFDDVEDFPAGFGMDAPIDEPLEDAADEFPDEDPDAFPDEAPFEGATEEPAEAGETEDVFGYDGYASSVTMQYEQLTNKTFKLVMDRPSGWIQLPGRHTLCFEEAVAEGQTPARMALTRKTSQKELTDSRITSELIAYLKVLAAQYDSFEVGDLNKETSFIGQMGYSPQYDAKKGDKDVRGYVIMAAVKQYLYVFHFSTGDSVFANYTGVMTHLRESIQVSY